MENKVKDWLRKVDQVKVEADLSRDEDLSIAIMNLISLEEHFYFTAMKTQSQKYLDMLNAVRELRKKMLKRIVTDPKGEEWCISKHLLAASMRLMEVGTKELSGKGTAAAMPFFTSSFELYSLFFGINAKLEDVGVKIKQEAVIRAEKALPTQKGVMQKFADIVRKVVDCCKE